jgi:hypothetical protein
MHLVIIIVLLHNYVGELVTLKSIHKDIRDNSVSFHSERDTLSTMLCVIGFNLENYDNR